MWEVSPLTFLFGLQAFILLIVCGLLLVHVRKRKQYAKQLEEKITDLRIVAGTSRRQAREATDKLTELEAKPPKLYGDFLQEQLTATRDYHQDLNPDRDIVLDIAPEVPLERRVTSLRYAFLLAEQDACAVDDEQDWSLLQDKLEKIIAFYGLHEKTNADADDIEDVEQPPQSTETLENMVGEHRDVIDRLRQMAADQQQTIKNLIEQLESTEGDQPELNKSLVDQLSLQQRFIDEARVCTQLLETELDRVITENDQLRQQGSETSELSLSDEDREQLQTLVCDLTNEGKDMLCAIAGLEDENRQLQTRLGGAGFVENEEEQESNLGA
jgi:hypothetical protein